MTSHEFMYVHFRLNNLSSFRKIGIARMYVCNPLCTTHTFFTYKYRGQIMGLLVQRTKPLDHFLDGILVQKVISAACFQPTECKQRKSQWKFYLLTQSRIHL